MPIALLSPVSPACGQSTGSISIAVISGIPSYTYLWSNGQTQASLVNATVGAYTVTVTGANGCSATSSATITPGSPSFSISAQTTPNTSCADATGAIDLSASTNGAFAYQWSNNAATQDIQGLDAGNYTVTVTDNTGCTVTGNYTIPEAANPPNIAAQMTPPDCVEPFGSIDIQLVNGGTPPLQYSLDGGQSFANSPSFDQLSPGNYQILVVDAAQCSDEMTLHIPQPILPEIVPIPDITLELGASADLHVQLASNYPEALIDTVVWTPNSGLVFSGNSVASLLNPTVSGIEDQRYTVTVFTKNGCQAQTDIRIKVNAERHLFAPNVILPDNPVGDNGSFTLFTKPGALKEILVLKIFDRWGNEVFSKEHFEPNIPPLGWNGDFKGSAMNPAVFVWWAEVQWADGAKSIYKGDVTVVR